MHEHTHTYILQLTYIHAHTQTHILIMWCTSQGPPRHCYGNGCLPSLMNRLPCQWSWLHYQIVQPSWGAEGGGAMWRVEAPGAQRGHGSVLSCANFTYSSLKRNNSMDADISFRLLSPVVKALLPIGFRL